MTKFDKFNRKKCSREVKEGGEEKNNADPSHLLHLPDPKIYIFTVYGSWFRIYIPRISQSLMAV